MLTTRLPRQVVFICRHYQQLVEASKQTHTHPFNGPFSGTTRVSRYHKGKTNLDFTEARDSEWQWHQLGHMQVCTSLQTDNHTSTSPLSFLQAGCPSCRPTNSVKALKAKLVSKNETDYSTMLQDDEHNAICGIRARATTGCRRRTFAWLRASSRNVLRKTLELAAW